MTSMHTFQKRRILLRRHPQQKKVFADIPEAIENTIKLAARIDLKINLGAWGVPKILSSKNYNEDLRELAYAGLEVRGMEKTDAVVARPRL